MSELDALWELVDKEEAREILVRRRERAARRAYYAAHKDEILAKQRARYAAKKKGTTE